MTLEIVPLAEEHLPAAAVLLAERHRRHRAAEPLLPAAYEDPDAAGAEIERLWAAGAAAAAAGIRDGRLAGYLVGSRRDDAVWGANGWVEHAGHAASDAEDVRDLYAAVAQEWVDAGRTRHFALVPASDSALVDAWFRLSFGRQQVHAIREVDAAATWPGNVRPAEPCDVDALVALAPLLPQMQDRAPAFAFRVADEDPDELRADIEGEVASDRVGCLVTEAAGRVVGSFIVVPVEMSHSIVTLARLPGECYLAWAATEPAVRGTGAGLALMQAADAWAHEARYRP